MYWSRPPGAPGCCAVASIRCTTWRALRFGNCARTSAARPATYGDAKLVPWIGPALPPSTTWLARFGPPFADGSSDVISVPGAATLTQGPLTLNEATEPFWSIAATESTSENHGGLTIEVGLSGSAWVFCGQVCEVLPAAATT